MQFVSVENALAKISNIFQSVIIVGWDVELVFAENILYFILLSIVIPNTLSYNINVTNFKSIHRLTV